jgi:hypothetical protein
MLTGTPTATGWFNVNISTQDEYSCPGSQGFLLQVCPAITITPSALPFGTVGTAYSQTLTASGGAGTYAWSTVLGTWPAGLSLSSAGVVSGTPTAANGAGGTVTVRATDADGCTRDQVISLKICPIISLPAITESAVVGTNYSQMVTATGGAEPYAYELIAGELPSGLGLDADTGEISGTPANATSRTFTVRATDANGCTGQRVYSIFPNCATLTLGATAPSVATVGEPYSHTFTTSEPSGLIGQYFTGRNFNTLTLTRQDPSIQFNSSG